jgi:hypothetical protein
MVGVVPGAPATAAVGDLACTDEWVSLIELPATPERDVVEPGTKLVGVDHGFDTGVKGQLVSRTEWVIGGRPDTYRGSSARALVVGVEDLGATVVQVVATRPAPGTVCPPLVGATRTWTVLAKPVVTVKQVKGQTADRAKVAVSVSAEGVERVTGKVKVTVSGTSGKSSAAWLDPGDKGTVELRLPKLARGAYTVTATFKDTTGKMQDGTAKKLRVKIK